MKISSFEVFGPGSMLPSATLWVQGNYPLPPRQVLHHLSASFIGRIRGTHTLRFSSSKQQYSNVVQWRVRPVGALSSGSDDAYDLPCDAHTSPSNDEGPVKKTDRVQANSFSTKEVLKKLQRYGVAGVLSYGLLNTMYYTATFLIVWFYVAPVPGRMGYVAAAERFLKVMAMVWAGSQVTKLVRAGGALALAPVVDRGLSWFTIRFKFESRGKAFMAAVWFCFGLALLLFLVVTLLWA